VVSRLGIGAARHEDELDTSCALPTDVRTDTAIYYRKGPVHTALNLKNAFDGEYFEGAQARWSVVLGTPFTVLSTIRVGF
jgi:hypothetical protein